MSTPGMSTPAMSTQTHSNKTATDAESIADELTNNSNVDSAVVDAITTLADEVAELKQEVADLREKNDKLRDELKQEREQRGTEVAETRQDLADLRETVEETHTDATDPIPDGQKTPFHEPETGLEDVVQLPEPVAEDTLTANQQRARFVAKDIADYTRSVPAGRAIKSSEIRRVLTAAEAGTVHSQTVARVMEFLDQLGEDAVQIRESQSGARLVVFDEDLVKRVVAYANTVVTDHKATTPRTV